MTESPAQVFAAQLLASLAKLGVRNFFLAPGARSQALAIAAGQLAEAGKIDLLIRLDERSLGFVALGCALASGEPSVIITTSGTAVANLHPAVLEASHAGVPLILLTADRPHELRGVGANQTTNQIGIFNDAVRECLDVVAPVGHEGEPAEAAELAAAAIAISLGYDAEQPGPVQLNLAFREPLSASEPNAAELNPRVQLPAREEPETEFAVLDDAGKTIVIAGAGAGESAVELAEAFGWPLFAEPSSGARFGANVIVGYRELITNHELADQITRVVVFGKPTLGRGVVALLKNPAIEVIVVRNRAYGHFDVTRRAAKFCTELTVLEEPDFEWLTGWRAADAGLANVAAEVAPTRAALVEAVWAATEQSDQLLLGASRLIREADRWAPAKPVRVFSNRGLAGIDGTVATATGLAIAEARAGYPEAVTRALIGDLTLLHDAGSLAFDRAEGELNIQLVVGNDHGGTIFESLEPAQTLDASSFERLFKTPQQVDIWSLAQAYGWQHILVESMSQLDEALSKRGRVIIEVKLA
ncbi:MAG: 2-succinyl-5-enolpyruvyl-6-hydroxy-3-cyclohexene-1-carboxylic-acid synthase [Micrococcales bacterium]